MEFKFPWKIFNRWLPSLTAIGAWVLLEAMLRYPRAAINWLTPILLLSVFLVIWQLTLRKIWTVKFWNYLLSPWLLTAAGLLFFAFSQDGRIQQVVAAVIALLLWLELEVIATQFHDRPHYQPHSLETISSYVSVLTIFFTFVGLANLATFLNLSLWFLSTVGVAVACLLAHQLFWASELPTAKSWRYTAVITVVIAELFGAVSWLPSSSLVKAMVVSLAFYLMTGISRNWLMGIKERNVVHRYLLIGFLALIVILGTAKWG